MHIHLFEFEDLSWFPNKIREGATDYLRYFFRALGFYKPVVPVLAEAMKAHGETQVLDLCSGGGGSIEQVYEGLRKEIGEGLHIRLSDKYPNLHAFEHLEKTSGGKIGFVRESVDATNVPPELRGFRTMFTAIHHFRPEQVRQVLKNAVDAKAGIAIFDAADKNVFSMLGILVGHPIAFVLWTPFFRPFRFSRIFFTYILPLIPLMTVWDGLVSVLRLYRGEELLKIARELDGNYEWKSGKLGNRFGLHVTYLVGYPAKNI
jgi:hypothetical protein